MNKPILDERVIALAKTLAERRGTTVNQAIMTALEAEIARPDPKHSIPDEFDVLANELLAKSKPGGRMMTRDDIDAMWGQ